MFEKGDPRIHAIFVLMIVSRITQDLEVPGLRETAEAGRTCFEQSYSDK